jgi:hypothetical protein
MTPTVRDWARSAFTQVWRTAADRTGFAVFSFTDPQPTSRELRQAMLGVASAFGELNGVPFVPERVGRFDQQVSTRFHRDGAPNTSLLLLGYEPTTVRSQLFLFDPHQFELSAFEFLQRFKPMTPEGEGELLRHAVGVLGDPRRAHIVVINNSVVVERPPAGHQLGVLHKGLIPHPDPTARRVINSMGLMLASESSRATVAEERWDWFLNGDTTE